MSDGVSLIRENPGIGRVIDTSDSITILEASYNISLKLRRDSVPRQIIEAIETEHDPYLISTLGAKLLPIERMVQLDRIWELRDLGSVIGAPGPNHSL